MRCVVRSRAWLDIEDTMVYLRDRENDETALQFWQKARETFLFLTTQPEIGRLRSDLKLHGLRSWRINGFENWLVFYGVGRSELEIFRVKHAMMDLTKFF